MAIEVKHGTLSTAGPYTPTGELGPEEWNEAHDLSMATNRLLGRTTAGAGAVEEISTGGGLTLSGGVLSSPSGTVTSVSGTGTVNGISLSGTVTASGNLTLGGTLSNVSLTTQVTGTLPAGNGGTGITSLGTGIATWLGTPSSANLASAITDETGSGALVFATAPTITNQTVTNYTETTSASTGNTTIDLANGTIFRVTTNGNNTITLPASSNGKSYIVTVIFGGTHTITWAGGGTIKWVGGSAPTLTSVNGKKDSFLFECDGTETVGSIRWQNI
jgi:hypothetical protein